MQVGWLNGLLPKWPLLSGVLGPLLTFPPGPIPSSVPAVLPIPPLVRVPGTLPWLLGPLLSLPLVLILFGSRVLIPGCALWL